MKNTNTFILLQIKPVTQSCRAAIHQTMNIQNLPTSGEPQFWLGITTRQIHVLNMDPDYHSNGDEQKSTYL